MPTSAATPIVTPVVATDCIVATSDETKAHAERNAAEKSTAVETKQADGPPTTKQREVTFIMIKPDGVDRGMVGRIIRKFEDKGNQLLAMRLCSPSQLQLEQHYEDLKTKPFFQSLIKYMLSGPVVCMLWKGKGVVRIGRTLLGETNPASSLCGTIRGNGCIEVGRNLCHASDSPGNGLKEAALWFPDERLDNTREMLSEAFVYE